MNASTVRGTRPARPNNIYRAEVHCTKADPDRGHWHLPGGADGGGVGARAPGE